MFLYTCLYTCVYIHVFVAMKFRILSISRCVVLIASLIIQVDIFGLCVCVLYQHSRSVLMVYFLSVLNDVLYKDIKLSLP